MNKEERKNPLCLLDHAEAVLDAVQGLLEAGSCASTRPKEGLALLARRHECGEEG